MNHCGRCVLPQSFPGISLDGEGICSLCRTWERGEEKFRNDMPIYEIRFQQLAKKVKEIRSRSGGSYDLLMAYSGGKDSTFTLKILRERFGLNILALTFNNGFLSPQAADNIREVAAALDVDHLTVSPGIDALRRAFAASVSGHRYPRKALERASPICQTCMGMVKGVMLITASEKGIPLLGYGWSPGQAPLGSSLLKMNLSLLRKTQGALRDGLGAVMGDDAEDFLLQERHYRLLEEVMARYEGECLYLVHPLAFLPYDEKEILKEIKALGWKAPLDTDPNSTNCLLNVFAIQLHQKNYGFHPYATEIAGLVRQGFMSREEGLAKLSQTGDPLLLEKIRKELKLNQGERP